MKKAKVAELISHLSSYLAQVKQGDTVVVCERLTPIARLVPFAEVDPDFCIREAGKPISKLGEIHAVCLCGREDVDKILRKTRENP